MDVNALQREVQHRIDHKGNKINMIGDTLVAQTPIDHGSSGLIPCRPVGTGARR